MSPDIDVDDAATWPTTIAAFVAAWASKLSGSTEYTGCLSIPSEADAEFRTLLAGCRVRAYHCTRLLDHERDAIIQHGMRPLTAELVNDRIRGAHAVGAITEPERDRYYNNHVFAIDPRYGAARGRDNRVCLFVSHTVLKTATTHGLGGMLDTWGGEALVSGLGWNSDDRERLKKIGRASIVVANLDLASTGFVHPALSRTFVGAALKLDDVGSELQHMAPIPADDIEAIWHPGDPEYDRYGNLPRQ